MILGRPTILWIGLVTAVSGFLTLVLVQLGHVDPVLAGSLVASLAAIAGSVITIIAGQPPVVAPGATVKVQTPAGQPNTALVVAADGASAAPAPDPVAATS